MLTLSLISDALVFAAHHRYIGSLLRLHMYSTCTLEFPNCAAEFQSPIPRFEIDHNSLVAQHSLEMA